MEKNLLLRLCLILLVSLTISSCRTDHFSENETSNNSSKFHLTSKRISLNESKHKNLLVPELEKVKTAFKNSKSLVNGKVVDYGNGVSIDTESVIYIENGPNFHTYTFNIKRENAPADAPLENLLLTPLAGGTYREFLVTYHLTPQEKENISNGYYFYSGAGTTITELAAGTFNGSSQLARLSCGWKTETIWTSCSSGEHDGSNFQSCDYLYGPGGTPPSAYTISTYSCADVKDNTIEQIPGPIGGGGSVGGGGECSDCPGNTAPQPCVQIPTDPTNPSSGMVDENGCAIGLPTLPNNPNDPDERTPCEVLKENSETPYIQTKLDSLKNRVALSTPNRDHHETGITITKRGQILKHKVFTKPTETGIAGAVAVELQLHPYDILAAHNHYEGTFPVPQFGDILTFYTGYKISDPKRTNAYTNYVVNFNGIEYAFRMSDTTALDALLAGLNYDTVDPATGEQEKLANAKIYKLFEDYKFDKYKDYTEVEALKILMKVLNDPQIGSGDGVHLYRRDKTTKRWGKLKLNLDGTVGQDDCPL